MSSQDQGSRQRAIDSQERAAAFYDEYGVREWLRLDSNARGRVVFELHRRILQRFVQAGDKVLDAGAGPGRFAVELVQLGATVTAGDISAVQVSLSQQTLARVAPTAQSHVSLLTVTQLPFADGVFDAVVCFGSVLSHTGDAAEVAAAELVRVTRPGGLVLMSVQSTQNFYLPYMVELVGRLGLQAIDDWVTSGRELPDDAGLSWRAFSHDQLQQVATALNCEILTISASNVLATIESIPLLEEMAKDETLWTTFLQWEEHLAQQRGNTERGMHIIAVLRKNPA